MSFEALQGDFSIDPVSTGPVPVLVDEQELQAVPSDLRHTALAARDGALMALSATGQVIAARKGQSEQAVVALRTQEAARHTEAVHEAELRRAAAIDMVEKRHDARTSAADERLRQQLADADAWAAREIRRINSERDGRANVATTMHEGDVRAANTERAMTMRTVDDKYHQLTAANEQQHQAIEQPIDARAAADAAYFQLCKNTVALLSDQVFQTQEELTSAARKLQHVQQEISGQEQRLTRLGLEVEGLVHDTQEAQQKLQASQALFERLSQESSQAQLTNNRQLAEAEPGLQATDIDRILGEHERGEQAVQASWRDLTKASHDRAEAGERITANRSAYQVLKKEREAVEAWLGEPGTDTPGARGYAQLLQEQVGGSVQLLRWLAARLDDFQDVVRNGEAEREDGSKHRPVNELRDLLGDELFQQALTYHKRQSAQQPTQPDDAATVDPANFRSSAKAGWFTPSAGIVYEPEV